MAIVHVENIDLSDEYRRKLCDREMNEKDVELLAESISRQHFQHKKSFRIIAIYIPSLTILIGLFLHLSTASLHKGNMTAIIVIYAVVLLVEALILFVLYNTIILRIPKQFGECLKKGYPELENVYGYKKIVDGSLLSDNNQ